MTLARLALLGLLRRQARTVLTILGVGLAVGGAVALLGLSGGIAEGARDSLEERGADLVVTRRGASDILGAVLPEAVGAQLAALPGVRSVAPELIAFGTAGDGQRHVFVAGMLPTAPALAAAPLERGRRFAPGETGVLLLGDLAAEGFGVGPGETVDVFDRPFTVIGILRWTSLVNRALVVMPLADLQQAAFRTGQVTAFHLRLDPQLDAAGQDRLRRAVLAEGPFVVSTAREILAGDRNLETLDGLARSISIIAMALGGLNVLAALLLSVQERTREIGMLAAIGWSDRRIILLVMLEGLGLGLPGCVLGLGFGLLASAFFGALPGVGRFVGFSADAAVLGPALLGALLVCLAGAAYPAWRAARMQPAEALRRI